ncbi:MAG: PIN domain-containing protein [Methanosphaera stadtmanae]|nr:PIN domain-containing protein [Methanosphaera stadtmanae]
MRKIMLNYDFLEALLFEYHENHEAANKIVTVIKKDDYLYIPYYVLMIIMKKLEKYNYDSNIKFIENISMTTRIDYKISKAIFLNAYELFKSEDYLNFIDCVTIQYMKSREIKYIISFDETLDNIKGFKRLYKIDEYNPHRLNFFN